MTIALYLHVRRDSGWGLSTVFKSVYETEDLHVVISEIQEHCHKRPVALVQNRKKRYRIVSSDHRNVLYEGTLQDILDYRKIEIET